jgi:cytosine/adenosine deaminase-related metal-dependent hydrolase
MAMLLIRGGLLIDTDPEPVVLRGHDLLIDSDVIAAVGPDLDAPDAEVVDGARLIVLPGFVDAHRHTWQTALRGLAADIDLREYMALINSGIAARYRDADVFTGTLAGAIEALAAGITTLQDYSHIQRSAGHSDAAVAALRESGVRAVFAYGQPLFGPALDPDQVRRVHRDHFAGRGDRLTLALAPLGPSYSSMEAVRRDWALAAELGLRIFTHISGVPQNPEPIETLRADGLLRPEITFGHGNSLSDADLDRIAEAGAAVAICPGVEARMGHGAPVAGRLADRDITTGLGVDIVSAVAGDMFSLMRATLLTSQFGAGRRITPAGVIRMATQGGANAVGLGDRIGSLTPGKQADLVLLRATDPNLLGGVHDPIGTVVAAAHPGNIERVLVAGERATTTVSDVLVETVAASARHLTA